MKSTDWQRLERLFHEAADLDTTRRHAFLEEACPDRPDLRERVEGLVRGMDEGDTLITGAIEAAARALEASGPSLMGLRVGAYEIVGELGRGGMGSVYEGRRADGAYEASVAIKIVRGALVDDATFRRFRKERRILGRLTHPNIARLLDAGRTPDGLPYMVMERVDGVPITEYCDRERLSVRQRLELFLDVCGAVEVAHANLVVHRDLKPANVLVTARGVPKLVDFGIAKPLDPDDPEIVTRTATQDAMLTPAYATPEQVRGGAVTVATDTYGLGLVLYELLTGRRAQVFHNRRPAEIERVVCETDPPTLRSAVQHGDVPEQRLADLRHAAPRQLRRALAGDLATIVAKALRKEPERRYGSVAALADDVRRYLGGRPVSARPDTRRYRLARFTRRHWAGLVVAAAFAVVVAGFVVQITRERNLAERRREVAAEVSDFLVGVFGAGGQPHLGGGVTAARVVAEGRNRIASLADRPAVQAGMMDAVGRLYVDLGLLNDADSLLTRALARRRALFGTRDADYAASLAAMGGLRRAQGRWQEAASYYRRAAALQRRSAGVRDEERFESRMGLAGSLTDLGRFPAADSVYARLVSDSARDGPLAVARVHAARAEELAARGRLDAARTQARDGLMIRAASLPADHPDLRYSGTQVARLASSPRAGGLELLPMSLHTAPVATPMELLVGDFDGDGRQDLLWNHRLGDVNTLYVGHVRPDGGVDVGAPFRMPTHDSTFPWDAFTAHVGDFNGDGVDDVLWDARGFANHVYVAFGKRGGGFRAGPEWKHPYSSPEAPFWKAWKLLVYDMNGDGCDDLAWYIADRMWVYPALSNCDGSFRVYGELLDYDRLNRPQRDSAVFRGARARVLAADLAGNGHRELVWDWLEDGNEMFAGWWNDTTFTVRGPIRYGDVGTMYAVVGIWHYYQALAGDVDGDGKQDLIFADPRTPFPPADVGDRVYVARSHSRRLDPVIGPKVSFQDSLTHGDPGPFAVRTGDVNGDGRTDLVWDDMRASGKNRVYVTLGRANDTFQPAPGSLLNPQGVDWSRATLHVADIDGDGRDELIWNLAGAVNRVWVARWVGGRDGG